LVLVAASAKTPHSILWTLGTSDLGWDQKIDWQEGLNGMVLWAKDNLDALRTMDTEFKMRA